ncbi:hypothetical protein ACIQ9E_20040 [Streptomyces sp. NPDC094448]
MSTKSRFRQRQTVPGWVSGDTRIRDPLNGRTGIVQFIGEFEDPKSRVLMQNAVFVRPEGGGVGTLPAWNAADRTRPLGLASAARRPRVRRRRQRPGGHPGRSRKPRELTHRFPSGTPAGSIEIRKEYGMNENAPTEQNSGLLIGVRRIAAARSRAEEASDNTGGKSDMNDT